MTDFSDILKQLQESKKVKFKDIRKVNIGLCKKDLTTFRKNKKGAFYNCFALILRIKYKKEFKEVHVKIACPNLSRCPRGRFRYVALDFEA